MTPAPAPNDKCYIITEAELKTLIYGKYAEHTDAEENLTELQDEEIYALTHPVVKAIRSRPAPLVAGEHACAYLDGELCRGDEYCQYKLTTACYPLGPHICGKGLESLRAQPEEH